MLGSSWVAAQLAASQEGLSSMSKKVSLVYMYEIYLLFVGPITVAARSKA
jgi:hypothetical protein